MIVPESKNQNRWEETEYSTEELLSNPIIQAMPKYNAVPAPAPAPVQVETEPDISENEPAARFAAESKPEEIGTDWETADRLDTPYSPLNFDRAALNAERRYREMLEQVSKPSLLSHPPTNQWLKQPENLGMAGNELAALVKIGDARERAIAADKARMEAENRAGRVSAWLSPFVSLGRGALNLAKLPEDILYLLHSFSAKLAEMPAPPKPETGLQKAEAELAGKERATESLFVKDPVTGEEFFNPQWINFSNAAKLLANEIPSAAAMIAATAATKGLAAPAAAAKYGPWVSRAYRLGKYMIQPAAVINTARVAQGVHDDGIKYLMAQGQTYEQAAANSAPGAILAGVASSFTGSPMEAKIIEGFAKSMAGQPATAGIGRRVLAMLRQFPIQGTKEAAQEVLEGIGEDVSKWVTFQPDMTIKQVTQNMVGNALGGAIVGGALGSALHSPIALQVAAKTDYMQSILEHIKNSKLPEKKLIEQIQIQTEGGPVMPTVHPEVLATLWQGLGEDPAEAAANRGLPEFMPALTAGTEIQLSPEAFVKMAKSGELDQIEMDLRAVPGEMTPREQDAYAKDKERLVEQVKAGKEPDEAADPDFQYIREYFRSQLLQAGRSADIAGTESILPAAALVNLARREGLEPRFLLETYAPTVTRPLPGEQGPIIKRALERIRAGEPAATVIEEEIQPGTPEGVQWWEEYFQRGGGRFASKAEKNRYRARLRALNTDRAYFANKTKAAKAEMEEDAAAFAAFEDELDRSVAGEIIAGGRKGKKRGKAVEAEPLGFFQYQDLGEGKKKVQLGFLEKADLTTFVHENTHFIMRVFRDLAARPEASEQIKKDWNALLEFVGADPGAEKLTIEQEEKLATAGERYLLEGKAPSNALKDAFARIKGWLQAIYELLKFRRLDARLNDDVRAVFDRIYASDEEIAQARTMANDRPLIAKPEDLGMTQGQFEAYSRIAEKRIRQAKERNDARIVADLVKDRRDFLEAERERLTPEVEAQLDADPVYKALDILSRGQLPDGTPIKLFKPSLVEQFGEKRVSDLPRSVRFGYKIQGEGSIDADGAAAILGFTSGEALIDALASAEKREVVVERLVDARVKELHGDPLDPAKLAEDAQAALHETEPEDKLIELRELERARRGAAPAVRQATKETREEVKADANEQMQGERAKRKAEDFWLRGVAFEVPPLQAFRDAAKEIIRGGTRGMDLNPNKYLNAQRKYSAEAFRALASKDYEKAAAAKQKELLNHYLYREAVKALEEQKDADKYVKTLMKPSIQKKIAQAGGDEGERVYLAQIWNILDKFQWTKESKIFLDTRAIVRSDIRTWLELEQQKGELPDSIDPEIFSDDIKNYRELTPDELSGVVDSLKVIHAAARRQRRALMDQKEIDYEEGVNWLVDSARQNFQFKAVPRSGTETDIQKAVSLVKQLDSSMRKLEQWVDRLDGGDINGPWRRLIFEPAALAQYKEFQLYRHQVELIAKALEKMPKDIRKNLDEVIDLPGIGQVTRKWLLSAALNTGNTGKNSNYEKLLKGEGWADPAGTEAFGKAMDRLTGPEWDFVQSVWDALATLKPEIEAQALRLDGIAPKWVEVLPFTVTLPDGTSKRLKGGYYPVVYDPLRSNAGKRQADAVFDDQTKRVNYPSTFQGYKQTRKEFARPFLLDFEAVLSRHIPKVIKDISHREAVLSIAKLLASERVQLALNESIGPEYGAQFWNWLLNLVNDSAGVNDPSVSAWRRLLSTGRQNMVAATLGFRASSAVVQLSDWSRVLVGAHAVKPKYLMKSILRFSAQFAEYAATGGRSGFPMLEEMRAVSPEMLSRAENLDRDVRGAIKRLTFENSWLTTAQRWGFKGLAIADALTSTTTWWAAYDQATAEGKDSETARKEADRTVRLKLMTGAPKDIAPIQAAGDMGLKFITMFMGDAINTYGIATEALANIKNRKAIASSAFALLMVGMIAPILADILKNKLPEDEDELKRYLVGKAIFGLPGSVPVLRDAVGAMQGGFDYKYTPVQTIIEKAIKTGKMGFDLVEGEKDVDWDDFFVTGLESVGMAAGIPGVGQVGTSYRFLDALEEGRIEPPGSKVGYTRALLFGPPPKPKGGK